MNIYIVFCGVKIGSADGESITQSTKISIHNFELARVSIRHALVIATAILLTVLVTNNFSLIISFSTPSHNETPENGLRNLISSGPYIFIPHKFCFCSECQD